MRNLHLRRVYTERGEEIMKESSKLADYIKMNGGIIIGSQGSMLPQIGREGYNIISYQGCTIIYLRDYSPTIGLTEDFCNARGIMGFSLSVIGEESLVDKVLNELDLTCPILADESISHRLDKTYGRAFK